MSTRLLEPGGAAQRRVADFVGERVIKMNISIDKLIMDKLQIDYLNVTIDNNNITHSIKKLSIDNILFFVNDICERPFFIFDCLNNVGRFENILKFDIPGNFNDVTNYFKYVYDIVYRGFNKIIFVDKPVEFHNKNEGDNSQSRKLIIENIHANILNKNNIFNILIDNINIQNQIDTQNQIDIINLRLKYDDMSISSKKISILNTKNNFNLFEFEMISKNFNLRSNTIQFEKTVSDLNIIFINANATNIVDIIKFITELIEQNKNNITTPIDEQIVPLVVTLSVINSNIFLVYSTMDLKFMIKSGVFNITTKIGINISANIFMNGYLIANLNASKISATEIKIESTKIFIDPEIFGQLNYMFKTLNSNSPTKPKIERNRGISLSCSTDNKISQADLIKSVMSQSFIVDDDIILDDVIKSMINNDKIKSGWHVSPNIIDNYKIQIQEIIHGKIIIGTTHINFYDNLAPHDDNDNNNGTVNKDDQLGFACIIVKDIEIKKNIGPSETKYLLKISKGTILDIECRDPEWKYFVTCLNKNTLLDCSVIICDNIFKIDINLRPLNVNIREETLIRLLTFFSGSNFDKKSNVSKIIFIEHFKINMIPLTINYLPLFFKRVGTIQNNLTLKDFKINLSQQNISHISGFDKLMNIIGNNWKTDINPENILQFIPNLKIIHPYTIPIIRIIRILDKYFKHPDNKKKIKTIIKKINKKVNLFYASMITKLPEMIDI